MDPARLPTPHALLTIHFLREFLENDLISPEADRSQLLALIGAMLVSLTLFASVFMSFNYVMVSLTPGQAAVLSLDDKAFYLALAMIVTALVATAQWDALAVNPRDAAVLEPLPVRAATIRRAKLAAVAILGAAVAVAVTACPSIVFPWLLVFNFPQLGVLALLSLIATHALVTIGAAAFGYLAVIALRETIVAALGPRGFARVSPWAQAALIVTLGCSFLLLPSATNQIARRGFEGWRALAPPIWFLGAYEMTAGGVIADLPRSAVPPRGVESDRMASAMYRERRERFPAMAGRAGLALGLTLFLAAAAHSWNARRLPSLEPAPAPAFRRRWRPGASLANTFLLHHAAARAGFYFTLAAMWRSSTHRLTLVSAAAAGCAMAVIALSNSNVQEAGGASPRLLVMQPLLYGALLVGFRHVIRVPAELRANWGFRIAWHGRDRAFLAGVKCAAVVALVLPALVVLLPFFLFVLGPRMAFMHAALGLAGAIVLLEALMLDYHKVPFACTYLPSENLKALAPIYVIAFLGGASVFARIQNDVLQGTSAIGPLIALAALFAVLRVMSVRRTRPPHVEFDEAPATFQRLGLDR